MTTITAPRPNMALATARASLAMLNLASAMHKRRGCTHCGYGARSCGLERLRESDRVRIAERIQKLEVA